MSSNTHSNCVVHCPMCTVHPLPAGTVTLPKPTAARGRASAQRLRRTDKVPDRRRSHTHTLTHTPTHTCQPFWFEAARATTKTTRTKNKSHYFHCFSGQEKRDRRRQRQRLSALAAAPQQRCHRLREFSIENFH